MMGVAAAILRRKLNLATTKKAETQLRHGQEVTPEGITAEETLAGIDLDDPMVAEIVNNRLAKQNQEFEDQEFEVQLDADDTWSQKSEPSEVRTDSRDVNPAVIN